MSLYLESEVIDGSKGIEEIIKNLEELFCFDNDHNGMNGENGHWEETMLNDCNSNIEYLVKKYLSTMNEDEDLEVDSLIDYVINTLFKNDSYYIEYNYRVRPLDYDVYFVSLACIMH